MNHSPLILGGNMFWARYGRHGLYHAVREGKLDAVCGKNVPTPRDVISKRTPLDDERCAKCDRQVEKDRGRMFR